MKSASDSDLCFFDPHSGGRYLSPESLNSFLSEEFGVASDDAQVNAEENKITGNAPPPSLFFFFLRLFNFLFYFYRRGFLLLYGASGIDPQDYMPKISCCADVPQCGQLSHSSGIKGSR